MFKIQNENKFWKYIALIVICAVLLLAWYCVSQKPKMVDGINEPLINEPLPNEPTSPGLVACTMEAKLCPDGSAVGRTGPKCEFAPCPTANPSSRQTGVLKGRVTLSPTCPVERMPPDPGCAPKPYATEITIISEESESGFPKKIQSDSNGNFETSLAHGNYTLEAKGGNTLPRCAPVSVNINSPSTVTEISCDTGIR